MMSRPAASAPENRRIDSWKEIAAFFGRDERTVKRWEKERGLPVHRLPGERGGVFAWSHELTAWLNSSTSPNDKADASPAAPPVATPPAPVPGVSDSLSKTAPPPRRPMIWMAAGLAAVFLASIVTASLHHSPRTSAAPRVAGPGGAAPHHVPDPEAQEFYLKGRYYWSRRTEASLHQAIELFTQALVRDSDYAQAYAGLAECYDIMPEFTSMPRSEAFPRAIAAARKAISLDDSLGEAHRALGFALFYGEWKVPTALAEYQRAIALDPHDEEAHHWYATSLLALGRFQQARAEIDKAQQLNPASRSILCDQALIRYWSGDRLAAVEKLREIEQAEPDFVSAPRYLASLALEERDDRAFINQTRRLATLSGDKQLLVLVNAAQRGLSRGGEHGMLEAMRAQQLRWFDDGQSSGLELARTCALLDRKQEAVKYLRAAVANHDYMVFTVAASPDFARLNGDPVFEELLRQLTERIDRA